MSDRPFRGGGRPEPEPKPFGKVILTRGWSRRINPRDISHERFAEQSYTGKLQCVLRAMTPLHIGSGIYELEGGEPARGLINDSGKPIVPGTSLKGAIRSIAEAISDSCARILRREVEISLAAKEATPCKEVKSRHRVLREEAKRQPQLCVCCSIFGALGYQGRVSFTDARLIDENEKTGTTTIHSIQSPYPPRDSAQFYRDADRRINGRKFYLHGQPVAAQRGEPYQVVKPDSEFEFTMQFESLTAPEFCLLLVAMGILDDIIIKIGGGKQAMLGSVEISMTRLDLQNAAESFEDFSGGLIVKTEGIFDYLMSEIEVGKAGELINEDALDALMALWKWPSNHKAPTSIY